MIILKIFRKYSKSMVNLEILKISENFEFFLTILEKIENFGKKLKILEKKLNILEKKFQSWRQILTARGVYSFEIQFSWRLRPLQI